MVAHPLGRKFFLSHPLILQGLDAILAWQTRGEMKPETLFTQAGRVFNFMYRDKKVACNYYFTRVNPGSPNQKLWMNVLFHLGERKEVYEITAEQSETILLIKPKKALDDKVQKFIEAYLQCFL